MVLVFHTCSIVPGVGVTEKTYDRHDIKGYHRDDVEYEPHGGHVMQRNLPVAFLPARGNRIWQQKVDENVEEEGDVYQLVDEQRRRLISSLGHDWGVDESDLKRCDE